MFISREVMKNLSNPSYTRFCLACAIGIALMLAGCGGGSSAPPATLIAVSISPTSVSIAVGTKANLNAIGTYSDGKTAYITNQVTWTSASSVIATVGANTGVVTAASTLAGSSVSATTTIAPTLAGWNLTPVKVIVSTTGGISSSANTLHDARYDHTASLLTIGPNASMVLVVGGYGTIPSGSTLLNPLSSAELYDPMTKKWALTRPLTTPRGDQTSVNLQDGRVLVTGGTDPSSNILNSSELYDPSTLAGAWAATGNLVTGRSYNSITLLPNGQVLVAGGDANAGTTNTAELYTPSTLVIPGFTSGTWTSTGLLATARNTHTATLLPSHKVLVAGGFNPTYLGLSSAELFDPATGSWAPAGSLATGVRYAHTATLLLNGQVLVVGGYGAGTSTLATAELYTPSTITITGFTSGTWTQTGSLAIARTIHTATLLPNGKVLVMGGLDAFGNALSSTELYDPGTGLWTTTSSLVTARDNFTSTLIPTIDATHPNGSVLSAGGNSNNVFLDSSELYY